MKLHTENENLSRFMGNFLDFNEPFERANIA
jgi:hypothetical protein